MKLPVQSTQACNEMSLPTRECGLKYYAKPPTMVADVVTPYAGVWIEISFITSATSSMISSLPTRECGLKYHQILTVVNDVSSLPTRECGLKFLSFGDGFIYALSLPTRECGLKYLHACIVSKLYQSLPTRECGLKSSVNY